MESTWIIQTWRIILWVFLPVINYPLEGGVSGGRLGDLEDLVERMIFRENRRGEQSSSTGYKYGGGAIENWEPMWGDHKNSTTLGGEGGTGKFNRDTTKIHKPPPCSQWITTTQSLFSLFSGKYPWVLPIQFVKSQVRRELSRDQKQGQELFIFQEKRSLILCRPGKSIVHIHIPLQGGATPFDLDHTQAPEIAPWSGTF